MPRDERLNALNGIGQETESTVVSFISGDRRGLETKIANDMFPMFHRILNDIGKQDRISLFLYSTGGITIAGFALVNLIREFCDEFIVIVPFKALSTATLIALGADRIFMSPMGQLSPIDPSIEHPLGPQVQIPGQPQPRIVPVNVEDINAFVDLAKNEYGIEGEESLTKAFQKLSDSVHPLVLGAVQRSRAEIEFLATTLMKHHTEEHDNINKIVRTLIRERFSHSYLIGRAEAKELLGRRLEEPSENLLTLITTAFNEYNEIMELDVPYNPELALGANDSGTFTFNRAFIEGGGLTFTFRTIKEVQRVQIQQPGIPAPVFGYQERLLREDWIQDNDL